MGGEVSQMGLWRDPPSGLTSWQSPKPLAPGPEDQAIAFGTWGLQPLLPCPLEL